jgi:hypothetical protein
MGLPGFEPGSREPESPSLDQASRQPLRRLIQIRNSNDGFKMFSDKNQNSSSSSFEATLEYFWTDEAFIWDGCVHWNRVQEAKVMDAFCW